MTSISTAAYPVRIQQLYRSYNFFCTICLASTYLLYAALDLLLREEEEEQ